MRFSVIIPVYKVEEYIGSCVQSVLAQSYDDYEIILVDDGSPDKCPGICDEYAKRDNRIKTFHKENGGLSDARNFGLDKARGEYIVFLDSDDTVCRDFLQTISDTIDKESHLDIICYDALRIPMNEGKVRCRRLADRVMSGIDFIKSAVPYESLFTEAWLGVYRREFLTKNNIRFQFGIYHEDIPFTPVVFHKAEKVIYIPRMFYNYNVRENSIMNLKDFSKNIEDTYNSCVQMREYFSDTDDIELKRAMEEWLAVRYLGLFRRGKCSRYGKKYVHKGFVIKNSHRLKTITKAVIFCVSPKVYCKL